jgi:NAD kinase
MEKIVLVTRKTRLEELVDRFNTLPQARFYISHSGGDFDIYEREHEVYLTAVKELRSSLAGIGKLQLIERSFLPSFLFSDEDLVVTIGVDGLVVNTAKYLTGQPLVAVNPDPTYIDGILLPFTVASAPRYIRNTFYGQFNCRQVTMAEAILNDGQSLLAFNDLFIGVRSHISAPYRIQVGNEEEEQSSSGIIVATGAGSTGWLSSLFNMAQGMLATYGNLGMIHEAESKQGNFLRRPALSWEDERLIFVVREPFVSKTSGARVVYGEVTADLPLVLESHMPEGGVIFSDGIEADFLPFNAGTLATIRVAQRKTNLVIA